MKATIYIPDDKAEVYEKAKTTLQDSISQTFVRCLERELENRLVKAERIVVELSHPETGRLSKKAFKGVWLIGSENEGEDFHPTEDGPGSGGEFSVAKTEGGRIAVLKFNRNNEGEDLRVFDDFDAFSKSEIDNQFQEFPLSLIAAVGDALGIEIIEEMDI